MFWGLLLVLIGILMLADQFGWIYGDFGDYFWPAVLIAIGVSMIYRQKQSGPKQ